jgi:hypothetical protein
LFRVLEERARRLQQAVEAAKASMGDKG